jgi:hypothetical protein
MTKKNFTGIQTAYKSQSGNRRQIKLEYLGRNIKSRDRTADKIINQDNNFTRISGCLNSTIRNKTLKNQNKDT